MRKLSEPKTHIPKEGPSWSSVVMSCYHVLQFIWGSSGLSSIAVVGSNVGIIVMWPHFENTAADWQQMVLLSKQVIRISLYSQLCSSVNIVPSPWTMMWNCCEISFVDTMEGSIKEELQGTEPVIMRAIASWKYPTQNCSKSPLAIFSSLGLLKVAFEWVNGSGC